MKKLYTLILYLALLALVACSDNLFGSSSPGGGSDIKSLRMDAENAFRKGNYEGSYNICKKIVEIEPSSSFGYYGMAKAGLWWHGVNPLSIFSLIKPEKDECPFMGEDVKVRNNYLQAMKKVVPALSELDRRDSLTALYELHIYAIKNKGWDTTITITVDGENLNVNLNERLSDFRKTFCDNDPNKDCTDTTSSGKRKPFPLSDREYKSGYFGGILLLSTFSKWFLNFFDTNKDSCLTKNTGEPGKDYPATASEWKKWGCINSGNFDLSISVICPKDEEGNMSVIIDSKQILEDLQKELESYYDSVNTCTKTCETKGIPDQIGDINDKIDDLGDAFGEVEDVLNSLGLGGSGDPDIDQASIKDEIDKYKAYASFYKMGTHFDEDGDGCIDEELLDGQDNDGDGFINENSRLAPTDPSHPLYGISSMNNSMWGNNRYRDSENWEYNKPVSFNHPVRICNAPDCSIFTDLPVNEEGWVTVINFTQLGYPDGKKYWTTRDANLKLEVAQDKNCTKYDLEYRKQKIGGCWPYYDQKKFRDYYCQEL